MNKKKQLASFVILNILILACQAGGLMATPTPPAPTSTTTPTSTPTMTLTPTATMFLARLETPITFKAGGFVMSAITGYEKETSTYQAFLSNPDESITMFIQADPKPSGKTPIAVVNSYMGFFKEVINDFSQGESSDIVIDSAEGIVQDFFGTVDEEPLHGRVVVVFPEDSKILTIVVRSIGEGKWESEGEIAYTAIIEKITFFKLEISAACPISTNRGYGFDKSNPIQIGGGKSNGSDREEEYLSALLGPHGEIVDFYRSDSIEINGVILDEYIIRYKTMYFTIYMDVYNYNEPKIPFGFNCSTASPLLPD